MRPFFRLPTLLLGICLIAESHAATKLTDAAYRGAVKEMADLVAAGADVNERDPYGTTSLHKAAGGGRVQPQIYEGSTEAVRFLIGKGADVNAEATTGITPLMNAATFGNVPTATLLLDHGANIDTVTKNSGETALMKALQYRQTQMVKFLLSRGASVRGTDINQKSVLDMTTDLELLALLKGASAKPGRGNKIIPDGQMETYQGTINGKAQFMLFLSREGESLRGFYFYESFGIPIELKGKLIAQGNEFLLEELGPKGTTTALFKGEFESVFHLKGTWSTVGSKPEGARPFDAEFKRQEWKAAIEQSYEGNLGKLFVRMSLQADEKGVLSGFYRYTGSQADLKLTGRTDPNLATGEFVMSERDGKGAETGTFKGIFVRYQAVAGTWTGKNGKALPFQLVKANRKIHRIFELGGGRKMIPQTTFSKHKVCSIERDFYVFTSPKRNAIDLKLNALALKNVEGNTQTESCGDEGEGKIQMEVSLEEPLILGSYLVFVGRHWMRWPNTSHGQYDIRTVVFNLEKGTIVELAPLLNADGESVMNRSLNEKLRKSWAENGAEDFDGYFADQKPPGKVHLDKIFPLGNGFEAAFSPYEAGPYVMGAVRVSYTKEEAARIFKSTAESRSLFGLPGT